MAPAAAPTAAPQDVAQDLLGLLHDPRRRGLPRPASGPGPSWRRRPAPAFRVPAARVTAAFFPADLRLAEAPVFLAAPAWPWPPPLAAAFFVGPPSWRAPPSWRPRPLLLLDCHYLYPLVGCGDRRAEQRSRSASSFSVRAARVSAIAARIASGSSRRVAAVGSFVPRPIPSPHIAGRASRQRSPDRRCQCTPPARRASRLSRFRPTGQFPQPSPLIHPGKLPAARPAFIVRCDRTPGRQRTSARVHWPRCPRKGLHGNHLLRAAPMSRRILLSKHSLASRAIRSGRGHRPRPRTGVSISSAVGVTFCFWTPATSRRRRGSPRCGWHWRAAMPSALTATAYTSFLCGRQRPQLVPVHRVPHLDRLVGARRHQVVPLERDRVDVPLVPLSVCSASPLSGFHTRTVCVGRATRQHSPPGR